MNVQLVDAESVTPQAWRNGGGQTRELLAWPVGGDWQLRISRADIGSDGPFSSFPGITRWFAVLAGAGVVLSFADGDQQLRRGDPPLQFDGAAAPGCRLLDGPTQDLNLMLRRGTGALRAVEHERSWSEGFRMRGLYTTVAGRWAGQQQRRAMPAHHLLWVEDAGTDEWTFHPEPGNTVIGQAWWLGFSPKE